MTERGNFMDSFLEKLADGHSPTSSSEHLKLLGKRAAGLFINKEAESLSVAVKKVVSEEGSLNRDQVDRVAELANQATWQSQFHEGGNAEAAFEPASGKDILDSLAEKAKDVEPPNIDYLSDPPGREIPDDVDLKEAFGLEKEPEEYEMLNPVGDLEATKEKVSAATDVLRYGVDRLEMQMTGQLNEFYDLVKQAHIRDGHGVLQIAKAVGEVCESKSFAQDLMKQAAAMLKADGVPLNTTKEAEKLAHAVVVNTDHPLIQSAVNFEKLAKTYHTASRAHEDLGDQNKRVGSYIRDKLRGV